LGQIPVKGTFFELEEFIILQIGFELIEILVGERNVYERDYLLKLIKRKKKEKETSRQGKEGERTSDFPIGFVVSSSSENEEI